MNWSRPRIEVVWQAVEAYLQTAYAGGKPPTAVTQRLETLRNTPADGFFECPVFERDPAPLTGKPATRYAIRLGNKVYPHMKIVIEPRRRRGALFRADTHDRHIRPAPHSREYKAFCELMENNQSVAEQIETNGPSTVADVQAIPEAGFSQAFSSTNGMMFDHRDSRLRRRRHVAR